MSRSVPPSAIAPAAPASAGPCSGDLGAAALAAAARGWPVFPLAAGAKRPATRHGLHEASTDPAIVARWWRAAPRCNIGLALGPRAAANDATSGAAADAGAVGTGLFVLDLDPRTDPDTGEVFTLERLRADVEALIGCPLPPTLEQETPSGGRHLFFRQPDGPALGNRRGLLNRLAHVDVRGAGGYVVLAPSVRLEAGRATGAWRFATALDPAEAPAALVAALRADHHAGEAGTGPGDDSAPPRPAAAGTGAKAAPGDPDARRARAYALAAFDAAVAALEAAREGTRNQTLNDTALKLGHFVGAGLLAEAVVVAALETVARGWPEFAKSAGTIRSGLTAGKAQPFDPARLGPDRAPDRGAWPAPDRARAALRLAGSAGSGAGPGPDAPPGPGPRDDAQGQPQPARWALQGGLARETGVGDGTGEEDPGAEDGADDAGGGGAAGPPARVPAEPPPEPYDLGLLPLTDLGNAERFVARHKARVRHCHALGWLVWDGRRWAVDAGADAVRRLAADTVRAIRAEADAIAAKRLVDDGRKFFQADVGTWFGGDLLVEVTPKTGSAVWLSDKVRSWARASESASKLSALVTVAAPWLAVDAAALDVDPMAINVLNGTLRVARRDDGRDYVQRHDHNPADLITKLAPVVYDPEATCPHYDALLERYQPDAAMRDFLHRWAGVSLTGAALQVMCFFYGMGANGKSTVVDAWARLAGDYSQTTGPETLLEQGRNRKGGDATPDLARLPGCRLLRIAEPDKGVNWNEGLIKALTGGEPIMARHLNRDFFEFAPSFKITMSGNHKPGVKGTDDGIWRRLRLVPWEVMIPPAERIDKNVLAARIDGAGGAERSGILNRLLDGLRDWLDRGLGEPAAVTEATAAYRTDSDPLGRFLSLCTEPDPEGRVQSSVIYAVFCAWAVAVGEKTWTQTGFSRAMTDRGIRSVHSNQRFFAGLRLVKGVADFPAGEQAPGQPHGWTDERRAPPGDRDRDRDRDREHRPPAADW